MHQSVFDAFLPFTIPLEGKVPWMYLDVKGLVTVGVGNLLMHPWDAMVLPFVDVDGQAVDGKTIAAAWQTVASRKDLAKSGHLAAREVTSIRLTDDGIKTLVVRKLQQNESFLKGRFPEWEEWPADAQLAVCSLAWAAGPAFHFPKLQQALLTEDFATAAEEIRLNPSGNPGLVPRNALNRLLMLNAEKVQSTEADRSEIVTKIKGYNS
jgi:GH24 family phage-related lysozyme (muramidase)